MLKEIAKIYNNNLAKNLNYWTRKYNQALTEIWQTAICPEKDLKILEKHGLGDVDNSLKSNFRWNWELQNLNKQYKGLIVTMKKCK